MWVMVAAVAGVPARTRAIVRITRPWGHLYIDSSPRVRWPPGIRRARCRQLRLDGEPVEACQVPTSDDGYYSGHIAYAWEHRGVVYHITIHGHANEPRLALMMAALINHMMRR